MMQQVEINNILTCCLWILLKRNILVFFEGFWEIMKKTCLLQNLILPRNAWLAKLQNKITKLHYIPVHLPCKLDMKKYIMKYFHISLPHSISQDFFFLFFYFFTLFVFCSLAASLSLPALEFNIRQYTELHWIVCWADPITNHNILKIM